MRLSFLLLTAVCVLFSGCIHHRSGLPSSQTGGNLRWIEGVTTRRDVVTTWGNPHGMSGDTWIWRERISKGGKVKASYYMIGMTVSNMEVVTREHRLTFGGDGVLTELQVADSVPGGAEWSLWPWW